MLKRACLQLHTSRPLERLVCDTILFNQAFSFKKLGSENRAAGGAPYRVVVQSDETVVEDITFP